MRNVYIALSGRESAKPISQFRWSSVTAFGLLFIIIILPLLTALRAVDFGNDGDETVWINAISESLNKSTFLPSKYNYPSLTYDIGLITLIPYSAFTSWGQFNKFSADIKAGDLFSQVLNILSQRAFDKEYRLLLRVLFVIFSSLSMIWIYLLVRTLRNSQFEGLVSAALLAGSWELNYQTRHIVPNALLMQFGILTLMFLVFADKAKIQHRALRYRQMAAIGAGLAFSAKYQGALLFIPVILSLILSNRPITLKNLPWRESINLTAIFLITFLIITPGAILQLPIFIHDIGYEALHYSVYGHGAHTVSPGLEHLRLMIEYLGREALSNYPVISLFCALISVIGIYSIWAKNRALAVVLLSVPLIYVLYMSRQRVMFVRNLLLVFPFLAIFAACGINAFLELRFLNRRIVRFSICIGIVVIYLVNALWLFKAADLIINPVQTSQIQLLATYIDQQPSTHFYLSQKVLDELLSLDGKLPPNIVHEPADNAEYAYYGSELFDVLLPLGKRPLINRSDYYTYLTPTGLENLNYLDVPPTDIVILEKWKLTEMGINPN